MITTPESALTHDKAVTNCDVYVEYSDAAYLSAVAKGCAKLSGIISAPSISALGTVAEGRDELHRRDFENLPGSEISSIVSNLESKVSSLGFMAVCERLGTKPPLIHQDSTASGISMLIPVEGPAANFSFDNNPFAEPSQAKGQCSYGVGDLLLVRQGMNFSNGEGSVRYERAWHFGVAPGIRKLVIVDLSAVDWNA